MFFLTVFWLQGLVFTGDTLFVAGLDPWNFVETTRWLPFLNDSDGDLSGCGRMFESTPEELSLMTSFWTSQYSRLFFPFVSVFFCCSLLGEWHLFIMLLVTASFGL